MFKGNRGQLSIFLGITLVLVMGMLAFIINIGLFVKAKINLQNAVDAAAYAGASVQARQLTNISYLNWEMRNNYKEWLFKYYVLGQISSLRSSQYKLYQTTLGTGNKVNFTLRNLPAAAGLNLGLQGAASYDRYNIPSVCIHNAASTDICPSYTVPGLPRFDAIPIAGISESHEVFVTQLVETKALDCSKRSQMNFNASVIWTFGEGKNPIPPKTPAILTAQRPGAWPRAVELAMRMRNLEMIVNRPPIEGPITQADIPALINSPGAHYALNERPYKAISSAIKNLGGGKYKDNKKDELSREFKLYELAPKVYEANSESLSGFLIPKNKAHPAASGKLVLHKHYLDLQAMPLNLAMMYSFFSTTTSDSGPGGGNIPMEATCGISKTAMPVPGFILGFVKNPDIVTYYAVKGESKFIGIFSPFKGTDNENGVTLTAYSAAKPFGGRIGPKLFAFKNNKNISVRESDLPSNRTLSHLYGLQIPTSTTTYTAGDPIPVTPGFWVNSDLAKTNLGGIPAEINDKPYFAIPNMIYDYTTNIGQHTSTSGAITGGIIDIKKRDSETATVKEEHGLYDSEQFKLLKDSLGPGSIPASYTNQEIVNAIVKARRPTKYDAVNYLVPDYKQSGLHGAIPFVTPIAAPTGNIQPYKIFAPLMGDYLLYTNKSDLEEEIGKYIEGMASAVNSYEEAIMEVAKSVITASTRIPPNAADPRIGAAQAIHINVPPVGNGTVIPGFLTASSCAGGKIVDLASLYYYFFQTSRSATVCGITPLKEMMTQYIDKESKDDKQQYFYTEYYIGSDGIDQEKLLSAYYPGSRQGASPTNMITHPLDITSGGPDYNAKRNFYSTKFFHMALAIENSSKPLNEPALREDKDLVPVPQGEEFAAPFIKNPLKNDASTGLGGSNPKFYEYF